MAVSRLMMDWRVPQSPYITKRFCLPMARLVWKVQIIGDGSKMPSEDNCGLINMAIKIE